MDGRGRNPSDLRSQIQMDCADFTDLTPLGVGAIPLGVGAFPFRVRVGIKCDHGGKGKEGGLRNDFP